MRKSCFIITFFIFCSGIPLIPETSFALGCDPDPCKIGTVVSGGGSVFEGGGLSSCQITGFAPKDTPCGTPAAGGCEQPACDGNGSCSLGLPVSAGTECRASVGICDIAEVCNGKSTFCPPNAFNDGMRECDNNLCTTSDTCSNGSCNPGAPLACAAPTQCQDPGKCDAATGRCAYTAKSGAACSSGNLCITGETCDASATCSGGTPTDCNDGLSCTADSCNSTTGACGNTVNSGFCVIRDACIASGEANPSNSCQICDPARSTSAWSAAAVGTRCDDGLFCTTNEACDATGACRGSARNCSDGKSCTTDSCDETMDRCDQTLGAGSCLIDGVCRAAGDKNPSNPCMACIPGISKSSWSAATGSSCDDGAWCTTDDACNSAGTCQGTARICSDGIACTTETCNEAADRCDSAVNAGQCLISGVCFATGAPNPSNSCHACNPASNSAGWSNLSNGTFCGDGNACNGNETCQAGACATGTPLSCTDTNPCTDDSCDPASGCQSICKALGTPVGAKYCPGLSTGISAALTCGLPVDCIDNTQCDDHDACNGDETCQAGRCAAGTAPDCNDANICTKDSCDKTAGCSHSAVDSGTVNECGGCVALSGHVDDACTNGGIGACLKNGKLACDGTDALRCDAPAGTPSAEICNNIDDNCDGKVDENLEETQSCGTDTCAGTQTKHCVMGSDGRYSMSTWSTCNTAGNTCNDNNACNSDASHADTCDESGICSGAITVACDDGKLCTTDGCDPLSGCTHSTNIGTCLIEGVCYASGETNPAAICEVCDSSEDKNAWSLKPAGTICRAGDGTRCQSAAVCSGSSTTCPVNPAITACSMVSDECCPPSCNSTNDADCRPSCGNGIVESGETCDSRDSCLQIISACHSNNACMTDTVSGDINNCNVTCVHTPKSAGTACDDGAFCTTGDVCNGAGACRGAARDCSDGISCTTETCNEAAERCDAAVSAGQCAIDGTCHAAGTAKPDNTCMVCNPGVNANAWTSAATTATCNDGNLCTTGDHCNGAGACAGGTDRLEATGTPVLTPIGGSGNADFGALAVLPDGRLLAAGGINGDIAMVRYNNMNLEPDPIFGREGVVIRDMGKYEFISSVAIQPDGKYVLGGGVWNGSAWDMAIYRFDGDGNPDPTFGEQGKKIIQISGYNTGASSIAIQPDGADWNIIVAGYANTGRVMGYSMLRLDKDGKNVDPGFGPAGSDGIIIHGSSDKTIKAMAIRSDGKIVTAGTETWGSYDYNFSIALRDRNGILIWSQYTGFGSDFDYAYSVAIQPDGKIVAAGAYNNEGFGIARYIPESGALDPSFNGTGKVNTSFDGGSAAGRSVIIMPNGNIVVAGDIWKTGEYDGAIVLYDSNGRLLSKTTTPIGSGDNSINSIVAVPGSGGSEIVAAGSASDGSRKVFSLNKYRIESATLTCDDNNPCTTNGCLPESGCDYQALADNTAVEGGGFCVGGIVSECPSGQVMNACGTCAESAGPAEGSPCGTCGTNRCQNGAMECVGDSPLNICGTCGTAADSDNDGDPDCTDCNPSNSAISHGAAEICGNMDDNCDGLVDEGGVCVCNAGDVESCTEGSCSGTRTCRDDRSGWNSCALTICACNPTEKPACGSGVCEGDSICDTTTGRWSLCDYSRKIGTECRASTGACDVAETCNAQGECPADSKVAAGTSCEADNNTCTTDSCDGLGNCALGTYNCACRPGDIGECGNAPCLGKKTCGQDGNWGACNYAESVGAVCRASAGVCDVAESCNAQGECPADAFTAAGIECRPAAGECDIAESCTGKAAACPSDSFKAAASACSDDRNFCTDDICSGSSAACAHPSKGSCDCEPKSTRACGQATCAGVETCDNAGHWGACVAAQSFGAEGCDGSLCTTGDACDANGQCAQGTPVTCQDDGNVCTTESCDPAKGCVVTNNTNACDDGNACTRTDACSKGACTGSDMIVCEASDQCHDAGTCNPANGQCSNPAKTDGASCTDASLCNPTCAGGVCTGRQIAIETCNGIDDDCNGQIDEGNVCVCAIGATQSCGDVAACRGTQTCIEANGVRSWSQCDFSNVANASVECDENRCTAGDVCNPDGTCRSGVQKECNDNIACTADSCNPASGECVFANQAGLACDDHNACTSGDKCDANGQCTEADQRITQCASGDRCCPAGCNTTAANRDTDCAAGCGNGVFEDGELCDTGITDEALPGFCPTACPDADSNACTREAAVGDECQRHCAVVTTTDGCSISGACVLSGAHNPQNACEVCGSNNPDTWTVITECKGGDGCCDPVRCNSTNDTDCGAVCGNGVLESGENCDTAIAAGERGSCLRSCPDDGDGNSCTGLRLVENACLTACIPDLRDGCSIEGACVGVETKKPGDSCSSCLPARNQSDWTPTVACIDDDGCCATGCTAANDNDCPGCGNGRIDAGEECDLSACAEGSRCEACRCVQTAVTEPPATVQPAQPPAQAQPPVQGELPARTPVQVEPINVPAGCLSYCDGATDHVKQLNDDVSLITGWNGALFCNAETARLIIVCSVPLAQPNVAAETAGGAQPDLSTMPWMFLQEGGRGVVPADPVWRDRTARSIERPVMLMSSRAAEATKAAMLPLLSQSDPATELMPLRNATITESDGRMTLNNGIVTHDARYGSSIANPFTLSMGGGTELEFSVPIQIPAASDAAARTIPVEHHVFTVVLTARASWTGVEGAPEEESPGPFNTNDVLARLSEIKGEADRLSVPVTADMLVNLPWDPGDTFKFEVIQATSGAGDISSQLPIGVSTAQTALPSTGSIKEARILALGGVRDESGSGGGGCDIIDKRGSEPAAMLLVGLLTLLPTGAMAYARVRKNRKGE